MLLIERQLDDVNVRRAARPAPQVHAPLVAPSDLFPVPAKRLPLAAGYELSDGIVVAPTAVLFRPRLEVEQFSRFPDRFAVRRQQCYLWRFWVTLVRCDHIASRGTSDYVF